MGNNLVETNRLIVRKLSLDDAELLLKYSQEEITKKELPDEVFEDIETLKETIEFFMSNYDNQYPLVYGIVLKQENCVIGHISLSKIDRGIEIGYAIATDYQNKGYASEIVIPFTKWATKYLKINKLYGISKKQNIPSWKILEKSGFTFLEEGIYPNYLGGKFPVKLYVKIVT